MSIDKHLLRARFNARAQARKVADLESVIGAMEGTVLALSQFIASEERRTRVSDVKHFTYSTAAKAATERSHRLKKSISDLETQLDAARLERDQALASLSLLEHVTSVRISVPTPTPTPTPASALAVANLTFA